MQKCMIWYITCPYITSTLLPHYHTSTIKYPPFHIPNFHTSNFHTSTFPKLHTKSLHYQTFKRPHLKMLDFPTSSFPNFQTSIFSRLPLPNSYRSRPPCFHTVLQWDEFIMTKLIIIAVSFFIPFL